MLTRRSFIKNGIITVGLLATAEAGAGHAAEVAPARAGGAGGAGSLFPGHAPLGTGQGIHPGRVVWMHDPEAVAWSGLDYWWKPENFDPGRVLAMTRTGLMRLTGEDTPQKAWNALFTWRNEKNGKKGGYRPGQKLAIKVNMNGAGEYNDDPHGQLAESFGNPLLLQTLLRSLVLDAGVRPEDITVFDTCRIFPDHMRALCTAGELAGVNFRYRHPGMPDDAVADPGARIEWAGDIRGLDTYFPTCLTRADYLIDLANLKGHSWGLTLSAKNHFGSFINDERRVTPAAAGLHGNIIDARMDGYSVLTDLLARREINGKTVLWMLDGLITAPGETVDISPENAAWEMAPFNGRPASSLFFSQDPVALDSVGADFLVNEPNMRRHNRNMREKRAMENYLHEAALLPSPPSGTKYTDGAGRTPESLGVHEHWNNAEEKRYSRDRGLKEGIELVRG